MTRRQIYFFSPNSNTYYLSEELNGDKEEFELFGSSDSCEKTWAEIAAELSCVQTLPEFMEAVARITHYYHSSIPPALPGTRLIVKHSRDELEVKDETWGIVSGFPCAYQDNRFSICSGEHMFYNGKPLFGKISFSYSSIKPGDYVTQDVVDDAMDCLPPVHMGVRCSQMGEPCSTKLDDKTGQYRQTYATFRKVGGEWPHGIWEYCGHCFCGETEERGLDIPIVEASHTGNVNE